MHVNLGLPRRVHNQVTRRKHTQVWGKRATVPHNTSNQETIAIFTPGHEDIH
jgi:hypothetical protein